MSARNFAALRAELKLPPSEQSDSFPADVMAAAEEVNQRPVEAPKDLTKLPFVTIDPPTSMDLDQAVYLERNGDGFRVHYAIADLGAVIAINSLLDQEARRRGQTIYLPDARIPLHPPMLSEDSLSLLPGQTRRACVWTIDVGADGQLGAASVERALVASVERFDYETVQDAFDSGTPHASIEPLRDLGELRQKVRLAAGAIDLALPEQKVVADGDGWTVALDARTAADGWNAEISLLTGMAAARLMLDAKVGLLRHLPSPDQADVEGFLKIARGLGIEVPDGATPGALLAGLDMSQPESLGLTAQATRLLRGAGYSAFNGQLPEVQGHAGIGGPYAHVTAPLRRLADRFSTEICLALSAGQQPATEVVAALEDIADRMRETDRLASDADRGAVDQTEVWVMQDRQDESFDAVVLWGAEGDRPAEVLVSSPAVLSDCRGKLAVGDRVSVRVGQIDAAKRTVVYVTA